ncbi:winged helix-turn-helix domain-containing protein [Kitasatospora nipponensis]|uniref:Winged helix-turn-helix domain-containing protein n=1 Tax=Kitasatospora nipponensis TaxID=258049 RepID=A0ABN1VWC3_9ACTN
MVTHRLSRKEARRIAVGAQLLEAERATDLLAVVRHLTLLQIDPTAAVAPSVDLIAWSRLGSQYRPEQLRRGLEEDRTLWEFNAMVRPMDDLRLYLDDMRNRSGGERSRAWLAANEGFRRDVLDRLGSCGALLSRDVPDTSAVPWPSSGWTNDRNVTQLLELLMLRGEVAVAGRRGRQRLWDLAERVYPADAVGVPGPEARRLRAERRLRSLGIQRPNAAGSPAEPGEVGEAGHQAVVEGVAGTWRVDPAALDRPFTGRTALLSPFDRLVHDRGRLRDLFGFAYVLEMYKPKEKRRWGYFALPVLHGDGLVGKVDAVTDRRSGTFVVNAVHEDVAWAPAVTEAVRREIQELAAWRQLRLVPGWPG